MRALVCSAAVLTAACVPESSDLEAAGAESSVVVPLVPVSDVAQSGVVGEPDAAGLWADLDDGPSFAAADDGATSVRTIDGRRTGILTSGFGAAPPGRVTDVVVHVRARRDATARKGALQVRLYAGTTLLGTGARHALGAGWSNLDDAFHGLSVGGAEELRTELVLDNASPRARGTLRATSLWLDVARDLLG